MNRERSEMRCKIFYAVLVALSLWLPCQITPAAYAEDAPAMVELGSSRHFVCLVDTNSVIDIIYKSTQTHRVVSYSKAQRLLRRLRKQSKRQIVGLRRRIRNSSGATKAALLEDLEKLTEQREELREEKAFLSSCYAGAPTQSSSSPEILSNPADSKAVGLDNAASVIEDLLRKIAEAIKLSAEVAQKIANKIKDII